MRRPMGGSVLLAVAFLDAWSLGMGAGLLAGARLDAQRRLREEGALSGGLKGAAYGATGESSDDDDGYAKVAFAALRAPVPYDPELGQEGMAMRDRALRSVVVKRVEAAQSQHRVMKEFMKSFARNLKMSVLEDSQGDMPEAERQAAIKALQEGTPPRSAEGDSDAQPPPRSAEGDSDAQPPPPPPPPPPRPKQHRQHHQHHHVAHMLNAGPAPQASAEAPPEGEDQSAVAPVAASAAEAPPADQDSPLEQAPSLLGRRARQARYIDTEAADDPADSAEPAGDNEPATDGPAAEPLGLAAAFGGGGEAADLAGGGGEPRQGHRTWMLNAPMPHLREHRRQPPPRPQPPMLFGQSRDDSDMGDGKPPRGWHRDRRSAAAPTALRAALPFVLAHVVVQVASLAHF